MTRNLSNRISRWNRITLTAGIISLIVICQYGCLADNAPTEAISHRYDARLRGGDTPAVAPSASDSIEDQITWAKKQVENKEREFAGHNRFAVCRILFNHDTPLVEIYLSQAYSFGGTVKVHHSRFEPTGQSLAASLPPYMPIMFLVIGRDKDDLNKITGTEDGTPIEVDSFTPTAPGDRIKIFWDTHIRGGDKRYAFTDANVTTKTIAELTVKAAPEVDTSIGFSAMYIIVNHEGPAFGLAKPVLTLGRSKCLTLDTVTGFGLSGGKDATLGGALTYSSLIGTKSQSDFHDRFGWPLQLTFTVGFVGLDVTHVSKSGNAFFGFGITIPTNAVNKK